jgi:hypothetical protein
MNLTALDIAIVGAFFVPVSGRLPVTIPGLHERGEGLKRQPSAGSAIMHNLRLTANG